MSGFSGITNYEYPLQCVRPKHGHKRGGHQFDCVDPTIWNKVIEHRSPSSAERHLLIYEYLQPQWAILATVLLSLLVIVQNYIYGRRHPGQRLAPITGTLTGKRAHFSTTTKQQLIRRPLMPLVAMLICWIFFLLSGNLDTVMFEATDPPPAYRLIPALTPHPPIPLNVALITVFTTALMWLYPKTWPLWFITVPLAIYNQLQLGSFWFSEILIAAILGLMCVYIPSMTVFDLE